MKPRNGSGDPLQACFRSPIQEPLALFMSGHLLFGSPTGRGWNSIVNPESVNLRVVSAKSIIRVSTLASKVDHLPEASVTHTTFKNSLDHVRYVSEGPGLGPIPRKPSAGDCQGPDRAGNDYLSIIAKKVFY